ncbi:hypothetical protein HDU97_001098 [Phlyctochytrium planicorne]|nr:hypothetical protein HDU97_001098 [Phlyctochytrium planicorne]
MGQGTLDAQFNITAPEESMGTFPGTYQGPCSGLVVGRPDLLFGSPATNKGIIADVKTFSSDLGLANTVLQLQNIYQLCYYQRIFELVCHQLHLKPRDYLEDYFLIIGYDSIYNWKIACPDANAVLSRPSQSYIIRKSFFGHDRRDNISKRHDIVDFDIYDTRQGPRVRAGGVYEALIK